MDAPSLFAPITASPTAARTADAGATAGVAQTQSLYRKYRPQTFDHDDLVGQEHVVQTLRNAIALGRVAHAYLFCGPRGTGKTTTARLLAKAVNCLDPDPRARPCNRCASCLAINSGAATDVIEIDAASNRGIDDIRDLRERVKYAPTQLRTKFYIVDEAHQITGAAANAFLKTLEEPPGHTKFVLATTDPEELLPTIVSRCQRFDFRRIGVEALVERLRTVAGKEGIVAADDALATIARAATGSARDALGLLDQLSVYQERADDQATEGRRIDAAAVRALLGLSRNDRVESLVAALADRDPGAALGTVNAAVEAGEDPRGLNRQLVAYLRILLHERAGGSPDADDRARDLAARFDLLELADLARRFGEIDYKIRHAAFAQLPLEVALVDGILRRGSPAESGGRREESPRPVADGAPAAGGADGRHGGLHEDRPSAPTRPRFDGRPAATGDEPAPSGRDPRGAVMAEPPLSDDVAAEPPPARPSGPSLRERVRNPGMGLGSAPSQTGDAVPGTPGSPASARRPMPSEHADRSPAAPRPVAPTDRPAVPQAAEGPSAGAAQGTDGSGLTVDAIADLWPRIRQDVKAINRRAEALLTSVDPVALSPDGSRITLAAAYDFHRKRLSEDDMRGVVEDVIGRLVGRPVHVSCVLRGEVVPAGAPSASTPAPAVPESRPAGAAPVAVARTAQPPVSEPDADIPDNGRDVGGPSPEDDARVLQAAKNIFDAEEIRG